MQKGDRGHDGNDADDDGALELARTLDTSFESGLSIGNGAHLNSGAAAIPPTPTAGGAHHSLLSELIL